MNNQVKSIGGIGAVLLFVIGLFTLTSSAFIVDERESALVIQLGQPKRVITEAGLYFKLPFGIQEVEFLDKRLLDFESDNLDEIILGDQKRIVVDTITRYRIADPKLYYIRVNNERNLRARLSQIIDSQLRGLLGRVSLDDILSVGRANLMEELRVNVDKAVRDIGIEIKDVRIRQADLPAQNTESIIKRMITERRRIAQRIRAEGEEESLTKRAEADRDRAVLLAESERISETIRGEGDRISGEIFAEMFDLDVDFYAFYQTLNVVEKTLRPNTSFIAGSDWQLLHYLRDGGDAVSLSEEASLSVDEQRIRDQKLQKIQGFSDKLKKIRDENGVKEDDE